MAQWFDARGLLLARALDERPDFSDIGWPARAPLYGLTPLHFAAWMGRYETASLLVSRGAPLDPRDRLHQGTPLGWARHHGHNDPRLLRLLGAPAEPAEGTP